MSIVNSKLNDNILTLVLHGRIDSTNAAEAEKQITAERAANPHTELVMDAEELEYISSAGLRVILRTRKEEPTLKIIGVTPEVYEIFEMTGFTEMLPVERAYRHVSIDGCEVIGTGATGTVYRIDPDTIVKVYKNSDALDEIRNERELSRKAFVLGIPTAIPYDVVKVGDKFGSVFELLNADTFVKLINKNPDKIDEYIGYEVEVLHKFHSTTAPNDLPDKKQMGLEWVDKIKHLLPEAAAAKLHTLFENLPESTTMMHGDFHIKNVMMQNGEVLLIDMDTLSRGNPVFEFSAMFNAYVAYNDLNHDNAMEFFGISYETAGYLFNKTLEMYLGEGADVAAARNKVALVGYTYMYFIFYYYYSDRTEAIEHYRTKLLEYVDLVDDIAL